MKTVPDVFWGYAHLLASTSSKTAWYGDKILCAHKEDLCGLHSTTGNTELNSHFYKMIHWEQKEKVILKDQTLALGCLWLRTMANRRPSGEKAGTSAPLDFTGWQGGVKLDMGYVLVAHRTLYPTELQKQRYTWNICTASWESRLLHRLLLTPLSWGLLPIEFSCRWWLASSQMWKQMLKDRHHP